MDTEVQLTAFSNDKTGSIIFLLFRDVFCFPHCSFGRWNIFHGLMRFLAKYSSLKSICFKRILTEVSGFILGNGFETCILKGSK